FPEKTPAKDTPPAKPAADAQKRTDANTESKSSAAQAAVPARPTMKVLMIGNSQMMVYDLPQMMSVMSAAAPADHPKLEIGRYTAGGMTLKRHWDLGEGKGTPRGMIAAEKWDYVVIQEIFNADPAEFAQYAAKFDEFIRKHGAKTLLFATANVTEHYGKGAAKYPDSFKQLNDMQVEFGQKKGVAVAPAGYTWMKYWGDSPTDAQRYDLYAKDRGHPGAKGTYIYACLLYASLTGQNPAGLVSDFDHIKDGVVISKQEAAAMQKAAWEQYTMDEESTGKPLVKSATKPG
ncbi:MAG: SGNH/GDSL hydrolase family protein, partial [Planctomycetota bacterium]|nr:SGNH/GDSL hydrolase family protein [Planctomycetota bacterium]